MLGALAVSGCDRTGNSGTTTSTHVLGEPKGTPLAVGQPAPAGTGQLGAISCASAKRCWAVGVAGPNPAPPGGAAVIVATTNGGTSWKPQVVSGGGTPQLSAVSCPTPAQCMAVGSNGASLPGSGVVVATTNGGSLWSPVTAPSGALAVPAVVCPTAAACTAVVSDGTVTWSAQSTDFGHTWQRTGNLPSPFVAGTQLWCAASGACLLAGYVPTTNGHGSGAIALSTDGGQTWALATVPPGTGLLQSALCPTPSTCLAGGTTSTTVSDVVPGKGVLLSSSDDGHTWTASSAAVPVNDVYSIACPTARTCAMVGTNWVGFPAIATGAVAQSTDGGRSFHLSTAAYVPLTLSAVDCPNGDRCLAVGGGTVARLRLLPPRRAHGPPIHAHQ
jgi:photosystem II stability/assembly factor-like uncharacterized protein